MVVRPIGWKTSETKAYRTHHTALIPPSPCSFGLPHQQLCSPSFRISPLHLEESLFSPHQQTGNYPLRNQSITRRQAPLTSYLVSRLLGLSGRGRDGGGWSHSAGLQTNPGRAGIGGVAGWERAMEQPSCKGQNHKSCTYLPGSSAFLLVPNGSVSNQVHGTRQMTQICEVWPDLQGTNLVEWLFSASVGQECIWDLGKQRGQAAL